MGKNQGPYLTENGDFLISLLHLNFHLQEMNFVNLNSFQWTHAFFIFVFILNVLWFVKRVHFHAQDAYARTLSPPGRDFHSFCMAMNVNYFDKLCIHVYIFSDFRFMEHRSICWIAKWTVRWARSLQWTFIKR